jgi:hypothetical protein
MKGVERAMLHSSESPLISNRFLWRMTAIVVVMLLLVVVINIAGHWYGKRIALAGHTTSTEELMLHIGQDDIRLFENTIRFGQQRENGAAERVDLYLTWPGLEGFTEQNRNLFENVSHSNALIFLQLSQSTMSRDMSGRFDLIYSNLLEGKPQALKYGLTLHRFRADSGYGREVILTAPRKNQPDYVVRCLLPEQPDTVTSGDCQRDVHIGHDLTLFYRFSASLLPDWEKIDTALSGYIERQLNQN